jgi:23S rRNA (uracil1939-C5)-methyltransferase
MGMAMPLEDKKVFVPFTLPGDIVADDPPIIVEEISARAVPPCPYFGSCGGCQLQHLPLALYHQFKKDQITAPLIVHKVSWGQLTEPIILGAHQRRRVIFKAQRTRNGVMLGYYQRQSHQIVNIDVCPLITAKIEEFIRPLRLLLQSFLNTSQKAEIAVTDTLTGLDVVLKVPDGAPLDLSERENLTKWAGDNNLARLALNDETIVAFRTPLVEFANVKVEAEANGFLQASAAADQLMAQLLKEHIQGHNLKIADLFSGRGTLTFPLLQLGQVDAYEMDGNALKALEKAARQNSSFKLKIHNRNLFRLPLQTKELDGMQVVVLDPPRVGATAQCKELAHSTVPQIIYLSCNPQSFARDAAILTEGGYLLEKVIPIDQFHWSSHAEIFGLFMKG